MNKKINIKDELISAWKKRYMDFTQYDVNILVMNAFDNKDIDIVFRDHTVKTVEKRVNEYLRRECRRLRPGLRPV